MKRTILSMMILLLFAGLSFAQGNVNRPIPQINPFDRPDLDPDPSARNPLTVQYRDGVNYCMEVQQTGGRYYVWPRANVTDAKCSGSYIGRNWRYTGFGHLSVIIGEPNKPESRFRYFCMADMRPDDSTSFEYVEMRPCAINDPRQMWKYDANTKQMTNQHTGSRLQEKNWYLTTARDPSSLYNISVTGSPNVLNKKIEPPVPTYDFLMSYRNDKGQYSSIYIDQYSTISPQGNPMFYNPETGQLFFYDATTGKNMCLFSRSQGISPTPDSRTVRFQSCLDYDSGFKPASDAFKWKIEPVVSNTPNAGPLSFGLIVRDNDGNVLGARTNSGLLYTVKEDKIPSFVSTYGEMDFVFEDNAENMGYYSHVTSQYVGSLGEKYCPAPGVFTDEPLPRLSAINGVLPGLPPNFNLRLWVPRLFQISSQPRGSIPSVGSCSTCILQAIEMILEMNRHGNTIPSQRMDAQLFSLSNVGVVTSFVTRFPGLADFMNLARASRTDPNVGGIFNAAVGSENFFATSRQSAMNVLINLTADEGLRYDRFYRSDANGLSNDAQQEVFNWMHGRAIGTLFMVGFIGRDTAGRVLAHAVPGVVMSDGVHLIPTNIGNSETLDDFRDEVLDVVESSSDFFPYTNFGDGTQILQIFAISMNPNNESGDRTWGRDILTVGNCTQGGAAAAAPLPPGFDSRTHGGGSTVVLPGNNDFNQCASGDGRCNTVRNSRTKRSR